MSRVAILVLGCASDPYPDLVHTIQRTWGQKQLPGIDIYYLFGTPQDETERAALAQILGEDVPPVEDGGIADLDNLLVAGCPDSIFVQEDCILHKRLIAFGYLVSRQQYDFIYTVCASSYVDQYELVRHIDRLDSDRSLISGAVGIDSTGQSPYVSGASMLLSADVAGHLADRRADVARENVFGFRDDVAISQWIAEHVSRARKEEIMDAIRTERPLPDCSVFVIASNATIDFVLSGPEGIQPRRGVFHYHFHSDRKQDMADFHERFFLHQTRSLWEDLDVPRTLR